METYRNYENERVPVDYMKALLYYINYNGEQKKKKRGAVNIKYSSY